MVRKLRKTSILSRFRWTIAYMGCVLMATLLSPAVCLGQDSVIGAVEEIVLLPWNVKIPARIDTGAATTSLDARDLKIMENTVEFRIAGFHETGLIRLPLKGVRQVRSASGHQKRPIVELTVCLGQRKMAIDVNLADRSRMAYPVLIGRNVIEQGFLVDVRRSMILPPDCSDLKTP